MIVLTCKTSKILMAIYKGVLIHIHILVANDCKKYIKFTLYNNTDFDIIFDMDNLPDYVAYIFNIINRRNRISLSSDGLAYIIQGVCLSSGEDIYNIGYIFINDYNIIMLREYSNSYDPDISEILAENSLRPIYNDLMRKINCVCTEL
jgi:hypothetical protein